MIDDTIDVKAGKAAREKRDLEVKEKSRTHKPLPKLEIGDLVYRVELDRKGETLIEDPCRVTKIRDHGESYYLMDLKTEKVYLCNIKYIKRSETRI